MASRVHNRHVEFLLTCWCSQSAIFNFEGAVYRDGRISDPTIRFRPDFHYPAKYASGRIACFTPDRIGVNYCVNVSQTIYRCMQPVVVSLVWLMLSRQSVLKSADQWSAVSFNVGRSRVYTMDDSQEYTNEESVDKRCMYDATGGSVTSCGISLFRNPGVLQYAG